MQSKAAAVRKLVKDCGLPVLSVGSKMRLRMAKRSVAEKATRYGATIIRTDKLVQHTLFPKYSLTGAGNPHDATKR